LCFILIQSHKYSSFLLYSNIPSDNNGSERAIINLKVKLKVSLQFKSSQGAKDYAILRSLIDTARKREIMSLKLLEISLVVGLFFKIAYDIVFAEIVA